LILTSPVASSTFYIADIYAPGKPVINSIVQEGRVLVLTITTPTEDAEGGDLSGLTGLKVALVDYSVDVNAITLDNLSELSISVQDAAVTEPGAELEFAFTAPYVGKKIKVVAFAYQDTDEDIEAPVDFIEDDEEVVTDEPQA
jgi:hypothetical protein